MLESERGPAGSGAGRDLRVGRFLANQRRMRGISVDELAALTKIPRRSLERLEAGAFDDQADGFARGFVRTVAEALGLDPDEAVMRLMHEPPAEDDEALGRSTLARSAALAGALALAIAALLGLVTWTLATAWRNTGDPEAERRAVLRRDPVRELARDNPPAAAPVSVSDDPAAAPDSVSDAPAPPATPGPDAPAPPATSAPDPPASAPVLPPGPVEGR